MAGYTKLFNSILASTIWREDDKTRIVWITLLAMADKNGVAETSIPSLADMARVSLDDCEAALEKLKSPDKYSRTKKHGGRRIKECDGGFFLLNHGKYRAKMGADERREYNRIKQQEHRQKLSNNVNDRNGKSALSAHTEAEADTEAKGSIPLSDKISKEGELKRIGAELSKMGLLSDYTPGSKSFLRRKELVHRQTQLREQLNVVA